MTALPPLAESDTAALPDDLGIPFISELTVDFFEDGQTLDNCEDLELITANIEHTYVGDLNMSVICPNGTEVVLMENNSFNEDINGCLTTDMNPNDLGVPDIEGFDYSWNMDAELILDEISDPPLDFAEPVPAGVYLPCGDLCDFVGCPLNGIWQFVIEETWGGDNGKLFNWNIVFNPVIVPDVTTFTPVIGLESDSSFWLLICPMPKSSVWMTMPTRLICCIRPRAITATILWSPTILVASGTRQFRWWSLTIRAPRCQQVQIKFGATRPSLLNWMQV